MKRRRHRPKRHFVLTSPEGYEIKQTAALAFRGSPTQAPVIGPHGEVLYGAAAATYLHHRGLKKGVPYTVPRYHSEEWHRRRELATRHARSR